jgi:hypothetical protein
VYSRVYIDAVTAADSGWRGRAAAMMLVLLAVPIGVTACGQSKPTGSAASTPAKLSTPSTPLSAPKTSFAQDTKFFTDVTLADPALVTYEQKHGNVALQALLTDGSAFCALLKQGGGIDRALVAEAEGARSTESKTGLPLSVTTFNTIESVALLTLCPSEQSLVPIAVKAKIRNLGDALAHRAG